MSKITFFPLERGVIDHTDQQIFSKLDNAYQIKVKKSPLLTAEVKTIDGVFVANSGRSTTSFTAEFPISVMPAHRIAQEEQSLGWVILFAFLGGLILNLMPCVLPVLSIKILSDKFLHLFKINKPKIKNSIPQKAPLGIH